MRRYLIGDVWYFCIRLRNEKGNRILMSNEDYGIFTVHTDAGCHTMPLLSRTFTSFDEFEGDYGVCFDYDETSAFLPGTYYCKACVYHNGDQHTVKKSEPFKVE